MWPRLECHRHHSSQGAPLRFFQLVLAQLALSDAVFAGSFLLAQPQLRNRSAGGGPWCQVASMMNEFGGLASTWLTVVMAWALHRALLHQRDATSFARQWRWIAGVCWGVPLLAPSARVQVERLNTP